MKNLFFFYTLKHISTLPRLLGQDIVKDYIGIIHPNWGKDNR